MKKPWVSTPVSSLPLVIAKAQPHLPGDDFDQIIRTENLGPGSENRGEYLTLGLSFFPKIFIYLFLAVLGLSCCMSFSLCDKQGLAGRGLPISVASLVAGQELWHSGFSRCCSWAPEHRLKSCGAQAQLLRGMWDLPGPGIEPMSPALAGEFFTTEPPRKP